jgi:hypothetical protein
MTQCLAKNKYDGYYNYNDSCKYWLRDEKAAMNSRLAELNETLLSASGVNAIKPFSLLLDLQQNKLVHLSLVSVLAKSFKC